MSREELKNLTEEEKQKIVDEINSEPERDSEESSSEEGTTSIFTMDDIDEKAGEGTAQAQYERSVTANHTSLATLHNILHTKDKSYQISRKNLIKLIFATLKLPEEGATLKFGGTEQQKQVCEYAYAQMQLAANTRAFILGVDAMRQARRDQKAKAEAAAKESEQGESKESKDE